MNSYSLCGYSILNKVSESSNSVIFFGRNGEQTAFIKVLNAPYPTPGEVAQFHHEYETLMSLQGTGVVPKALGLEPYENSWALIMEGSDSSRSLHETITSGGVSVEEFLRVAILAADALERIHERGVFHQDVKPQNIILKGESGLELIDFGTASRITAEVSGGGGGLRALEGTLAYISPEQTRRMNRRVDYRTDFYSLGITFYQMLAGVVPFTSAEPMEVIHAHIARQPTPLTRVRPDLPQAVADIVAKLLSKDAEQRYKSGLGVRADLERCRAELQSTGVVQPFPLGERDVPRQLIIPEKLYGRAAELKRLIHEVEAAAGGACEIMLVGGYSGIGKTVLVNEIQRHVTKLKTFFISGKYDQFQVNTPYSAIGQAFSGLVRGLLLEPAAEVQEWRRKILQALGPNAQIIVDLVPELELVVGEQPAPEPLGALESRNRFNLVFQRFLAVFANRDHPVVLFLDDLQWVDLGSLNLIKNLLGTSTHFLVIASYRDNEVTAAHPLMHMVAELGDAEVEKLLLTPLDLPDLTLLLAETLNSRPEACRPLADLVMAKTAGNPFFVREFLHCLFREGKLRIDRASAQWEWDLEGIRQLEVTENVVDLMSRRIQDLPPATQHSLRLAACIGSTFALKTLAIACDTSLAQLVVDLSAAMEQGMAMPSGSYSRVGHLARRVLAGNGTEDELAELVGEASASFMHDRVQQAAYELIPAGDRARVHLKIGQLLLEQSSAGEANLLEIVNHLNMGSEHITAPEERVNLAKLNLGAGRRAQNASAYQTACGYITKGIELLGAGAWEHHYETAYSLHVAGGECHGQLGNYAEAVEMLDAAFTRAVSDVQKSHITSIRLAQYSNQGLYTEGILHGIAVLREFGLQLPAPDDPEGIGAAFGRGFAVYQGYVSDHGIDGLFNLPTSEDIRHQSTMSVLVPMLDCAIVGMSHYMGILTMTMVAESCAKGNTPESSFAYIWLGVVLIGGFRNYTDAYRLGELALKLNDEKFQNKALTGRLLLMFGGFIADTRLHPKRSVEIMDHAYQVTLAAGDQVYAAYSLANSVRIAIMHSGLSLQACTEMLDLFIERLEKLNNPSMRDAMLALKAVVLNLRGLTDGAESLNFEEFDHAAYMVAYESVPLLTCISKHFEMQRHSLMAHHGRVLEIDDSTDFSPLAVYVTQTGEHLLMRALAHTQLYAGAERETQVTSLEKIRTCHAGLTALAEANPVGFAAQERMVAGELARIQNGDLECVARIYDEAIDAAKASGLTNYAAVANELAATMWHNRGCMKIASYYMEEARHQYAAWGCARKVQDLETRFPQLLSLLSRSAREAAPQEGSPVRRAAGSTPKVEASTSDSLDLMAAVDASQTLSSEINLSKLLMKMMEIVMKISGAQRALLLSKQGGSLVLEAQVTVDDEFLFTPQPMPAEECADIAISVVRYVDRTQTPVVLNQATEDETFGLDEHIQAAQVKSLMCLPVVSQRNLTAVLYLENNVVDGAFTSDRSRIMNILSSQMAISIENARLYAGLEEKVAERTRELKAAQEQLVTSAHKAGMAEIATGILHNVGNILNSMKVSGQLVESRLKDSRLNRLPAISSAISTRYEVLIQLIRCSENGPALLDFIEVLADVLVQDHSFTKEEMGRIMNCMEQISDYVRLQQDYVMEDAHYEPVDLALLVEAVLMLQAKQLTASYVQVERQFQSTPSLHAPKNKLAHVLLNLIINAREAMEANAAGERRLTLQIRPEGEDGVTTHVVITVADTGEGISPDQLATIYNFGFTTRKDQHGFGLHTAANSMGEMGGEIKAESAGPGRGASFTLRLPVMSE